MRSARSTISVAAGGERIAGAAALEQARAELLLDLAEPAEHRGMVDAEVLARARERSRLGDRLDIAEIVPRQHTAAPSPLLLRTQGMTANPTPFPARTQACRRDARMVEARFLQNVNATNARFCCGAPGTSSRSRKRCVRQHLLRRCANRWSWTWWNSGSRLRLPGRSSTRPRNGAADQTLPVSR